MDITTTRFGTVTIDEEDVLTFVDGLIGMEDCRRWALLGRRTEHGARLAAEPRPAGSGARRGLSAAVRGRLSRPRVPARRRAARTRRRRRDAQVLAIVNQAGDSLALNLKAPLVIHVATRLGRQIVAKDNHSVQHLLSGVRPFRRTA